MMLSVGFSQILCSYFSVSCGLINLTARSAAKRSTVRPCLRVLRAHTPKCVLEGTEIHVCLFAVISVTCLNPAVHFQKKKSQLFFHTSFHSSASLIPLRTHTGARTQTSQESPAPTSLPPPIFLLHVIEVAARAGSQGRVVRFLLSTSLSALCAGTLSPSRTSFLTAHVVTPLPFNMHHHSPPLFSFPPTLCF